MGSVSQAGRLYDMLGKWGYAPRDRLGIRESKPMNFAASLFMWVVCVVRVLYVQT